MYTFWESCLHIYTLNETLFSYKVWRKYCVIIVYKCDINIRAKMWKMDMALLRFRNNLEYNIHEYSCCLFVSMYCNKLWWCNRNSVWCLRSVQHIDWAHQVLVIPSLFDTATYWHDCNIFASDVVRPQDIEQKRRSAVWKSSDCVASYWSRQYWA